jgi:hypothetical protein
MPKTIVTANLLCYGTTIEEGDWGGVKLSYLLSQAGQDPTVASVDFTASDGYLVTIPIQTAMQDNVIIAYELNYLPLSEGLRLVIPEANGNLWISEITSIQMNTNMVNQGISGSGESGLIGQDSPSTNSTIQFSQQQPQVTLQPAAQNRSSVVEPTATPTSVIVPQSEQKISSFPDEAAYLTVLGIVLATVVVTFLLYRVKKSNS